MRTLSETAEITEPNPEIQTAAEPATKPLSSTIKELSDSTKKLNSAVRNYNRNKFFYPILAVTSATAAAGIVTMAVIYHELIMKTAIIAAAAIVKSVMIISAALVFCAKVAFAAIAVATLAVISSPLFIPICALVGAVAILAGIAFMLHKLTKSKESNISERLDSAVNDNAIADSSDSNLEYNLIDNETGLPKICLDPKHKPAGLESFDKSVAEPEALIEAAEAKIKAEEETVSLKHEIKPGI